MREMAFILSVFIPIRTSHEEQTWNPISIVDYSHCVTCMYVAESFTL